MLTPATLGSIASRYGIPPTILNAALQQGNGLPDHIAAQSGVARGSVQEENVQAEIAARSLAQSFTDNGSWDRALSAYFTGDPAAAPGSAGASQALATIGLAAVNPSFGMDGYDSGGFDAAMASKSFSDLGTHWGMFADQGGVISHGAITAFSQRAQQLVQEYVSHQQGSAGGVLPSDPGAPATPRRGASPGGGSMGNGAIPGGLVTKAPFQGSYGVTQGFGESGEQGADFATPEGTPVFAGFGGTVHIENYGSGYTGLSVWVDNGKGWQFFAGHMLSTAKLVDGQTINPGDLMGTTGGGSQARALGEAGHSTGPHSEIQIRQVLPGGRYIYHDPASVVQNAGKTSGPIGGATLESSQGFLNPDDAPPPEVVTAAHAALHTNAAIKQATAPPAQQKPPTTSPQDVAHFKIQANAAGIQDPGIFQKLLPYASALYRSLTGTALTLDHLASLQGMDKATARQAILAQPHPTYPHLTLGDMKLMGDKAALHSIPAQGRMPHASEVSRLVAMNAGPGELHRFYSDPTQTDTHANVQASLAQQAAQQQQPQQGQWKQKQGGPQ